MDDTISDAFVAAVLALIIGAVWPGYEPIALGYFVLKVLGRIGCAWEAWSGVRHRRQREAPPPRRARNDPSRLG